MLLLPTTRCKASLEMKDVCVEWNLRDQQAQAPHLQMENGGMKLLNWPHQAWLSFSSSPSWRRPSPQLPACACLGFCLTGLCPPQPVCDFLNSICIMRLLELGSKEVIKGSCSRQKCSGWIHKSFLHNYRCMSPKSPHTLKLVEDKSVELGAVLQQDSRGTTERPCHCGAAQFQPAHLQPAQFQPAQFQPAQSQPAQFQPAHLQSAVPVCTVPACTVTACTSTACTAVSCALCVFGCIGVSRHVSKGHSLNCKKVAETQRETGWPSRLVTENT